jgi:amidohydrolase
MAGEDFSDYLAQAPGTFAFVGFNNPAKDADYPHHHPKFKIDEDALAIGVELHVRTALEMLNA